jgi:NAD(P)H-hydrate epimerase
MDWGRSALLTPAEMAEADRLAIAGGVAGFALMANAGAAIAAEIRRRWPARPVTVLCGPGNNGGDGFVVARLLAAAGWQVRVALLGERAALRGDAAAHAALWDGEVEPLRPDALDGAALVVDAIFGAGLARDLDGAARQTVEALGGRAVAVVAVDVPSGVDGAAGAVRGGAPQADLTVTFFRKKPGHLLLPGRLLCGEVVVADIGIRDRVLDDVGPTIFENGPALWGKAFPWPRPDGHKYSRGHVLLAGGPVMTGAARLAARAAGRIGAGLVTVAAPASAWPVYAAALTSTIVQPMARPEDWPRLLADERRNAILLGPGAGHDEASRGHVLAALGTGRAVVLDADALTLFAAVPDELFAAIRGPAILTPHAGEFRRLFPLGADRLAAARAAARASGAVILLKGSDTVIAAPDGRAIINANAPPELATAGSGDVLAGMCVGLLAQGMPGFLAAAAACWLHGAAAASFGPGLVAEDIVERLPRALRRLRAAAAAHAKTVID